jgi:LacI family transcriptional regulator
MKPVSKNVTIKSIAEALGVSFSTVSKALNNNPLVKEETRNLVFQKADEMGYSPNMLARGLRAKETKTIGVVFNDIENPVLTYIFKNIAIDMAQNGYTTFICDSQFDGAAERANICSVLSRMPDCIILAPASASTNNLDLLAEMGNHFIFMGEPSNLACNYIDVDYQHGGYLSASEVLLKGHRDILIITEPLDYPYSAQFVKGIQKAFGEYGVPFRPEMMRFAHASIDASAKEIAALWDADANAFTVPFTAVLTFDDNLAHGVYKAAAQIGLSVPQDISVIGFDDAPLSSFSMPPLTTVHLPKEKMAKSCIDILHSVLIEGVHNTSHYSLTPHLVDRNSVRSLG